MRFLIFILFVTIISCTTTSDKKPTVLPYDTKVRPAANGLPLSDAPCDYFPCDTIEYAVHILGVGSYHNEEVWKGADTENWQGLFRNGNEWYITNTKINITKAHDGISDETETDSTGWNVSITNNIDTALLLFSGHTLLQSKVKAVKLDSAYILPGDTMRFSLNGQAFSLFATGRRVYEGDDKEYFDLADYKLYLRGKKDGQIITQAIMIQSHFEENRPAVWFVGDMDGDGFPDLIIDTSNHYNAEVPTLYLSKPAGKDQLLKVMGLHVSVFTSQRGLRRDPALNSLEVFIMYRLKCFCNI
jgi:hypothetical protein